MLQCMTHGRRENAGQIVISALGMVSKALHLVGLKISFEVPAAWKDGEMLCSYHWVGTLNARISGQCVSSWCSVFSDIAFDTILC